MEKFMLIIREDRARWVRWQTRTIQNIPMMLKWLTSLIESGNYSQGRTGLGKGPIERIRSFLIGLYMQRFAPDIITLSIRSQPILASWVCYWIVLRLSSYHLPRSSLIINIIFSMISCCLILKMDHIRSYKIKPTIRQLSVPKPELERNCSIL